MLSIFFCSYFYYLCIILYNHQWVTDSNTSRVTDVSGNNNDNDNWSKKYNGTDNDDSYNCYQNYPFLFSSLILACSFYC